MNKMTDEQKQVVCDNLNLVDYCIQKRLHIPLYDNSYEDYQQEGRYGLCLAAMRYDASTGHAFSTYAMTYIEGYVRRYRREMQSLMHVPRHIIDLTYQINKLQSEGYTYEEIQLKLSLTSREMEDIQNTILISSLDTPVSVSEGDTISLHSILGHEDLSIIDALGEERLFEYIERVAEGLSSDKRRSIWYDYIYPAYYGENVTQKKLAKKYGLTQSVVSRILIEAKDQLSRYLSSD